jgi:glucose/arabinose dehydrogenase
VKHDFSFAFFHRRFVLAAGVLMALAGGGWQELATAAGSAGGIGLRQVAEGFCSPLNFVPVPDDSGRAVVADQTGELQLLSKEGPPTLFLDLRNRLAKLQAGFDERGVLGLAFHPQFARNRRLFVFYSAPLRQGAPAGWDHTSHLSEFRVREDRRDEVDPQSERVLLQIDEPQFNHNSGRMAFGPEGYLYVAVGDGGNANDSGLGHSPQGNAQDLGNLLGKVLRLDVDKGEPFASPADNPFAQGGGRPEIFAYGLRNPWGLCFDREGKRELFVADVGQDSFEEVNIIVKGGNYGWRLREAFVCFDPAKPTAPPDDCARVGARGEPLFDPILAYKNFKRFAKDPEARGISITGGYVYRGKALPELSGRYVFADWSRQWAQPEGVLYVATRPATGAGAAWTMQQLPLATHPGGTLPAYVLALGENSEGELYVLTNDTNRLVGKTGKVFKLVRM